MYAARTISDQRDVPRIAFVERETLTPHSQIKSASDTSQVHGLIPTYCIWFTTKWLEHELFAYTKYYSTTMFNKNIKVRLRK